MTLDSMFDSYIKEWGAKLETAFREKGTPLPQGLTGEILIRAAFEDMEKEAKSPEAQARFRRLNEIATEIAAKLPGGMEHPDFPHLVQARLHEVFGPHDTGPAASA